MTTGDSDSSSSPSSHGGNGAIDDIKDNPDKDKKLKKDHSPSQHRAHNNGGVVASVSSQNSTTSSSAHVISKSRSRRLLEEDTNCIQVANIAPQATKDQMASLFGYMGKVEDLRLYPTMDLGLQHTSKICFVKFRDSASVGVAQHLTNTVFVDRALIVIPYSGDLPDEMKGVELLNSGSVLPGVADPKLPQHVTSQLEGIPPAQVVVTTDPKLDELQLPPYPNLPPNCDSRRIEEIRRTVMIANIDPELSTQDVSDFFGNAGEVKYIRICNRDNDPLRYALIEFSEQPSVLGALKCNGTMLGSKTIKVYHSTQAIVKPQAKTNEAAQKEIEEAMTRQAQNLLTHGLDGSGKDKRRTPSPLRGRHSGPRPLMSLMRRSRSRTRSPRRRSGSRSRRRRSRTRSRSPRRIRRSRSRSRGGGSGRVLRSPHRLRGSRSKSRDKERERKRSSSRNRRSKRSSSRDKRREKKSKKDRRSKDRERDGDRESKEKGKENGVKKEKDEAVKEEVEDSKRDRERKREKRKSLSRSPSRDSKYHSPSHEKRKRSKSKKKKRGDSDREDFETEQSMDIE